MSHKRRSTYVNFPEALPLDGKDANRFWAKVQRTDDCWWWTGSKTHNGYGQFGFQLPGREGKQRNVGSHRVAYELSHGPIPYGQWVLHRCDQPLCVNPSHLFLGDHAANMRDASRKGRLNRPRRQNRVARQEAIRRYLCGGIRMIDLAAEFGVSKMTVHRWLKRHHRPYERPKPARHERVA